MVNTETNFIVEIAGKRYKLTLLGWVDAETHVGVPTSLTGVIEQAAADQGRSEKLDRARQVRPYAPHPPPDAGTVAPNTRGSDGVRRTHCYQCKRTLNSACDASCGQCGWLVCSCGACGCGFVM
ncbi:MAG: hypothetical protein Q7T01_02135 [bacterium]|nr:hypothetical protein [bacterium]